PPGRAAARLAGRGRQARRSGRLPCQVQVQPPVRLDRPRRHIPCRPSARMDVLKAARDPAAFSRANTALEAPRPVPEIALQLASEITPIWEATEATLEKAGLPPPYWAFAWAGGQALARYVLDNPETVRGRAVLDFGAGSGLVAIAAAKAGAARVLAADID